jgi:hypothetical protein
MGKEWKQNSESIISGYIDEKKVIIIGMKPNNRINIENIIKIIYKEI